MLTRSFPKWWYLSSVLLFSNIQYVYAGSVYAQTINLDQIPPNLIIPTRPLAPETPVPKIPSPTSPLNIPSKPGSKDTHQACVDNQRNSHLIQETPSTSEIPEQVPGSLPQSIIVTEFKFAGNTVFQTSKLEKCITYVIKQDLPLKPPFKLKSPVNLPLSKLLAIAAEISDYYKEHGYTTSGAVISIPQETEKNNGTGPVIIKIIEDKVENIIVLPYDPQENNLPGQNDHGVAKLKGKPKRLRLNPEYIRSRLAIVTSKPLNIERLKEALQLLRLNAPIENIFANLAAGSGPGKSILVVKVQEAENFHIPIGINNSRSPSGGSFQRQIGLNHGNFLGLGDTLAAHYNNTDGSNGFDFSYTLPINPYNGTFNFTYTNSSTHVIESPFNQLDINSNSRTYDFTLRQPISQVIKNQSYQEFAIGNTFSRKESESYLLGMPYPLSPGADSQGRTRISALRFFQEWTQQNPHEVIALRSQFNVGIGAFNVTINQAIANEVVPDNRFFHWQGQAQYIHIFAPETLLLFRSNIQIAGRTLVPLEQFALGGFGSVRGYRQDTILADNGLFSSLEFRYPFLRIPKWKSRFQIIPFTDYGTAWDSSGKSIDTRSLASVGLGLQFQQGEHLTARLDWGIPLINVTSTERTWQENGLTFSVLWNPF